MGPVSESGNKDLAWWLDKRRAQLDMTWDELADAAGLVRQTLVNIRDGLTDPYPKTLRKLEAALQWEAGSIDIIRRGGDPIELDSEGGEPTAEQVLAQLTPEQLAAMRKLMQLLPYDEFVRVVTQLRESVTADDTDSGHTSDHG